jgi:hypothetical protein
MSHHSSAPTVSLENSQKPISTASLGGTRYFVTFKDYFRGYITIYFMKKKKEVPALIRLYHAMLLNETGYYMLTFRSDIALVAPVCLPFISLIQSTLGPHVVTL